MPLRIAGTQWASNTTYLAQRAESLLRRDLLILLAEEEGTVTLRVESQCVYVFCGEYELLSIDPQSYFSLQVVALDSSKWLLHKNNAAATGYVYCAYEDERTLTQAVAALCKEALLPTRSYYPLFDANKLR